MFDTDSFKEIKTIKQSELQTVILVADRSGKRYLKRIINGDKREIYKTLQKIEHENIPKIYYVGFDDNTVILEEYINGISLSDYMEQKQSLNKKQIYSVTKQILSALDTLHKFEIIHRDIKPDNILIDKSNKVWLIDYDIARIYRNEIRRDTETKGTFGYAPIEQYGMLPTDYKTDIYAFGMTLKTLLDYANIKGHLYKVAEKCKRLDPSQRYENIAAVKRSLLLNRLIPAFIALLLAVIPAFIALLLAITLAFGISFYHFNQPSKTDNAAVETTDKPSDDKIETGIVKVNDKNIHLIRFLNFTISEKLAAYCKLENFNTTPIFSGEGVWDYLPVMEDMKNSGTILLGKNHGTSVNADISLNNGVFSVNLKDELNHSFSKDFYFDGSYNFNLLYPDNRRLNAEMVCRDLDGDNVEELLIGVCDCSITVTETAIYPYFNYSIGWVLKYDEARGFILCEGDMFSENSKLVFVDNDLRVHLPYAAANTKDKFGYELAGNKIIPIS